MEKTSASKTYNSVDYKSLTEAEKTVFRNVVSTLSEKGIFDAVDAPVIAAYARNVVLARTAAKDIERMGTVIEFQDRGYTKYKENPAVGVMTRAQNAYETTAIKLGLTPTGRKKMKGEGKQPQSELDKLLEEIR